MFIKEWEEGDSFFSGEDDSLLGKIGALLTAIFSCWSVCVCEPPFIGQGIKQQQEERTTGQILVRSTISNARLILMLTEVMCLLRAVRYLY